MSQGPPSAASITCPQCRGSFEPSGGVITMCPHCGYIAPTRPKLQLPTAVSNARSNARLQDVRVECKLCNTLYYATRAEIGQTKTCPDCHSLNVVPQTVEKETASGPTLNDPLGEDEFQLSAPIDTPKYQALTRDARPIEELIRAAEQTGTGVPPSNVPAAAPLRPKLQLPPAKSPIGQNSASPVAPPAAPNVPVSNNPPPIITTPPIDLGDDFAFPPPAAPTPRPTLSLPSAPHAAQATPPQASDGDGIFLDDDLPAAVASPDVSPPVAPPPKPNEHQAAGMKMELPPQFGKPPPLKPGEMPVMFQPEGTAAAEAARGAERLIREEEAARTRPKKPWYERNYQSEYGDWQFDWKKPAKDLTLRDIRRNPFTIGIVSIFQQPQLLARMLPLGTVLAILIYFVGLTIQLGVDSESMGAVIALVTGIISLVIGIFFFIAFARTCLTVFEDTANGFNEITGFPELNFMEWIYDIRFFAAALFVAGLPGAVMSLLASAGGAPPWSVLILFWPSMIVLFPPVLISMLEGGTIFQPVTQRIWQCRVKLGKFWGAYYFSTIVLAIVSMVVVPLAFAYGPLSLLLGAIVLQAIPYLYFRLLGRMGMVYRDYTADMEEQAAAPPVDDAE